MANDSILENLVFNWAQWRHVIYVTNFWLNKAIVVVAV